ncbi:MAG: tetratricopeptide repeat protein [Deltaproteobacteria bacterium]|nr:tetratricopeptide repeat protein [Deltaproteobacteria bacterium]
MSANAYVKNISERVCYVFFSIIFLLSGSLANAFAEDCSRARELYTRGTKLLNYEERKAVFQKAVDLCPSYAEAHCNLADALENQGVLKKHFDEKSLSQGNALLDEAVKHYQKAIELKNSMYQPHLGLAEIYLGQARYALAAEEFKKVCDLDPGNERARSTLERIKEILSREPQHGLRKSDDIITRAKDSHQAPDDRTMGVEDHTVRDRESFENILFAGWSAQIAPGEPTEQVDEIGEALSSPALAGFDFVVEGHTNIVGSFDKNMNLSWDRSSSVKNYLVKKFRIDPGRLVVQGFGYTRPKVSPDNDPRNRRVEIVFLQKNAGK